MFWLSYERLDFADFGGFWWVLVQIRWADDRGGRSGGKSGIPE